MPGPSPAPPSAAATPAKPPHIRALTGLRGLAAWAVVVYHFRDHLPPALGLVQSCASQGFLAVDLFFILSGFVVELNYARLFPALSWEGARRFAVARLARIYPLHLFISLCFLVNPLAILLFSRTADPGPRYAPGPYVMNLFLVQNWGFTRELSWNIPSWSISVEAAAYLLFPFVSLAAARFLERRSAAILAIAVALGGLAAIFLWSGIASLGDDIPRLGLIRCLLQFTVGILLCRIYRRHGPPGPAGHALLAGGAAILAGLMAWQRLADFFYVPAVFALVIFAVTSQSGLLSRLCGLAPLVFLGEVSYSTYLGHYFIKDWVNFLVVTDKGPSPLAFPIYLGAVFAASLVLYRLVELPGRSRMLRWTRRSAVAAATS